MLQRYFLFLVGDAVEGVHGWPVGVHQWCQQRPGRRLHHHRYAADRAVTTPDVKADPLSPRRWPPPGLKITKMLDIWTDENMSSVLICLSAGRPPRIPPFFLFSPCSGWKMIIFNSNKRFLSWFWRSEIQISVSYVATSFLFLFFLSSLHLIAGLPKSCLNLTEQFLQILFRFGRFSNVSWKFCIWSANEV